MRRLAAVREPRRIGAFYTPERIAHRLTRAALAPLAKAGPFRLIDPACGDGAFLRAARHEAPQAEGFGVDLNPEACAQVRAEGFEALCADALLSPLPAEFDALLANPPYLSVKRAPFSALQKQALRERYRTARGQFDACGLFIERSLQLLRPGGRYALLVPRQILTNGEHEAARRLLFEEATPELIFDFGAAFPDAAVEVVGLVGSRSASREGTVRLVDEAGESAGSLTLADWADLPGLRLPLRATSGGLALCKKLRDDGLPLRELATRIERGVELGQRDRAVVGMPGRRRVPLLRGRDVAPFRCEAPVRFLDLGAAGDRGLKRPELFEAPEKLLVRRVANRLIAAVDRTSAWTLNTLYCVQLAPGVSADAVACAINSRLLTLWWRGSFGGDDRIFPYLRAEQLAALPLPRRGLAKLERLGRAMAVGRSNGAEMNLAVEKLYGLGPAERAQLADG